MPVVRSSTLGWSAGQNITTQFASIIKTMRPFDELVLDHKYQISGGPYQLPDDFTLSAVMGAGFNVTDSNNSQALLLLGHRNVLRNVTFSCPGAPIGFPATVNAVRGTEYHDRVYIRSNGKDDCIFEYCRFEHNIGHHVVWGGGRRTKFRRNHVAGAYWSAMLYGACHDFHLSHNLFEKSAGEALKTGVGGTEGVQRPLVEHCIFQGNRRDGIDTTGGFKDGIIRDCIFRRNDPGGVGGGLDFKTFYDPGMVPQPNIMNTGIRVERCRFIDARNAVVLALVDRAGVLTTETLVRTYAPNTMQVIDCEFERTIDWPYEVRAFLWKGGHTVQWTNLRRVGTVTLQGAGVIVGTSAATTPGALNYGLGGTELASLPARGYDSSVPFVYGPQASIVPGDPGSPPPGPAIWIDQKGVFHVDTDRSGSLQKNVTVRAVNAVGAAQGSFELRVN